MGTPFDLVPPAYLKEILGIPLEVAHDLNAKERERLEMLKAIKTIEGGSLSSFPNRQDPFEAVGPVSRGRAGPRSGQALSNNGPPSVPTASSLTETLRSLPPEYLSSPAKRFLGISRQSPMLSSGTQFGDSSSSPGQNQDGPKLEDWLKGLDQDVDIYDSDDEPHEPLLEGFKRNGMKRVRDLTYLPDHKKIVDWTGCSEGMAIRLYGKAKDMFHK
jgi:hypothetical protein